MPDAVTPTATPDAAPAAAAAPAATPAAPATEPAKEAPAADPKADLEKQWAEFKPVAGFDKEALKEIVAFAQKEGIPPKAAVALAQREQARSAKEEADFKHLSEKGWLEELNKDPDLGGPKVRETMVNVMRASDRLDPKVQSLIKEHGVLYNPVVVRILHDIGSKMKEDSFVRPGASPAPEQKKTLDQRLESIWAGK